jgi:hypothetical protein
MSNSIMSNFHHDLNQEEILAAFLDKHYTQSIGITRRSNSIEEQFAGIDFYFKVSKEVEYRCDEKAQLSYLNKDLPTFALELDYLKDGKINTGWLFDAKKLTDIYAFVFSIKTENAASHLDSVSQLTSCEVVFVNRIRLLNELSKYELTDSICREKSYEMREDPSILKHYHYSGFNFQLSAHLAEQPINLVVRKDFLVSIGKRYLFEGSV